MIVPSVAFLALREGDAVRRAEIRSVLQRSLTAGDLALPRDRLYAKLGRVGRASGRFGLREGDDPHLLTPVARSRREWTVVLQTRGDDGVPVVGLWLGVRGGRVVASLLPDRPNMLEGPLFGAWRRRGGYLLAAGTSLAFHSPAFADGAFLVFAENAEGIAPVQKGHVDFVKAPVAFRSSQNDDLVSRDEAGAYQTLDGFRATSATREIVWRFAHGRYRPIRSRTVHDRLWALDRLATAIRRHEAREIARMVPDRGQRPRLVEMVRRSLAKERRRIEEGPHGGLGLFRLGEGESRFFVRLSLRHGRWIVARIERLLNEDRE